MATVMDLFSGAGGMSYGFHANPHFEVVAAVDAQVGKPSSGPGKLSCNSTYEANIGVKPFEADLSQMTPEELVDIHRSACGHDRLGVLICCAPCTGFSRVVRSRLVTGDPRNDLVSRTADFVDALQPQILVMENVKELLTGNFSYIFESLKARLEASGYTVYAAVHKLEEMGLPQRRRRALIIASRDELQMPTLENLWEGWAYDPSFATVRHAIGDLPKVEPGACCLEDAEHVSPKLGGVTYERLRRIPKNGGSWRDLLQVEGGGELLIPSMKAAVSKGNFGGYADVYGRMAWDTTAPTIKRECAHVGNGRYSHPEQNRLCTVRELALLQGFPSTYKFISSSLANRYRHIGDAVPPSISYQIAHLCSVALYGEELDLGRAILPGTSFSAQGIVQDARNEQSQLFDCA